jgi:hypothetical protein
MAKLKTTVSDDSCVCLYLSLTGNGSCRFSSHCESHFTKKTKLANQETKNNNMYNVAAVHVPLPVPVTRRARNWGFSTGLVIYDDPWKVKKVLTQTDLGSNCNILIKRELVKDLIVPIIVESNRKIRKLVY